MHHHTLGGYAVELPDRAFAAVAAEPEFSELITGLLGHRVPGITERYGHTDSPLLTAADQVSACLTVLLGNG
jgi:hypothetical protein